MGKDKKRKLDGGKKYEFDKNKRLIELHTEALTKKGKLKGKNKKETKALRDSCTHHKLGKHGKIRHRIELLDNGHIYCTICGHEFDPSIRTKEEVKSIVGTTTDWLDAEIYYATALDFDEKVIRNFAETKVLLGISKKQSKKVNKIVQKEQNVVSKKKLNSSSSSTLGVWNPSRRKH